MFPNSDCGHPPPRLCGAAAGRASARGGARPARMWELGNRVTWMPAPRRQIAQLPAHPEPSHEQAINAGLFYKGPVQGDRGICKEARDAQCRPSPRKIMGGRAQGPAVIPWPRARDEVSRRPARARWRPDRQAQHPSGVLLPRSPGCAEQSLTTFFAKGPARNQRRLRVGNPCPLAGRCPDVV